MTLTANSNWVPRYCQRKGCPEIELDRGGDAGHALPVAPNTAWVPNITYIATGEGWLYLVAIIDLFSHRVVGWKTSDRLDASAVSPELLLTWEGVLSMNRRGNCWDNAVAESFWSTLKAKLTEVTRFPSRDAAHAALLGYLEGFDNHERRHSRLDYVSPAAFERLANRGPVAA